MRRLGLAVVLVLALAGCGRESEVAFRESGGGGTPQGIAEGEPAPGTDPDEPTSDQPMDDTGEEPVSPGGDSGASKGSTGSNTGSGAAGGGTSGSTGSTGSSGSGQSEPGGVRVVPEPTTEPSEPHGDPPPGGDDAYTEPEPGQADVRAREWESAEVQPDDRTIVVTWWTGVEPCHVLDRVEVREEAERIVITLYEGHQPGFDGGCAAVAVQKKTKVTVSQPVAGREIVDGAKLKPGQ